MFEAETKEAEYYLENFIKPQKHSVHNIKNKDLRSVVLKKIKNIEAVLFDLIILMKHYVRFDELERSEKLKKELFKSIWGLEHDFSNFIATQENPEIILIEELDKANLNDTKQKLLNTELNEINLMKFFKKLISKIELIFKKYHPSNREEIEIIMKIRIKIKEIFKNLRQIIKESKIEMELVT